MFRAVSNDEPNSENKKISSVVYILKEQSDRVVSVGCYDQLLRKEFAPQGENYILEGRKSKQEVTKVVTLCKNGRKTWVIYFITLTYQSCLYTVKPALSVTSIKGSPL